MTRTAPRIDVPEHRSERNEPFRIMVIYDDMPAGLGAQYYLGNIARQLGEQQELDVRFWKHDILSESHLWSQATADAAEMDLLLFSMSTSLVLPTRIIRWMQRWQDALTGNNVSFGILAAPECHAHSLVRMARRFLQKAARFHETRFFTGVLPETGGSGPQRTPDRPSSESTPAAKRRRDVCGQAKARSAGRIR